MENNERDMPLNPTASKKLVTITAAIKVILSCLDEDIEREGLLKTPERCAKALLYFTSGYRESVAEVVNGAIFHHNHHDLVTVKDIEVSSLCEHHLVPFIGKVRTCGSFPLLAEIQAADFAPL
jgi:GTP cyclohydrolase I